MSSSAGAPIPDFQLPYTAYGYGGQNGRVNLNPNQGAGGSPVPDSAGFSYPKKTEVSFAADMLRGNWDHTAVSDAFFTRKNANIMRAMYLQYAKNNTFNIEGQINELNELIVKWAAPRIMSEIEQYNYYLNDISHLPIPLEQPMNMSSAGTRSLPFQPQM